MSSKPQKLDKKDWHLFSKSRAYRGEMSFCLCYSFLSAVCSVVFKPVFRLGTFQNWLASWKKLIKSQRSCSIYSKIVTVTVKCLLLFLLIFLAIIWYCFLSQFSTVNYLLGLLVLWTGVTAWCCKRCSTDLEETVFTVQFLLQLFCTIFTKSSEKCCLWQMTRIFSGLSGCFFIFFVLLFLWLFWSGRKSLW